MTAWGKTQPTMVSMPFFSVIIPTYNRKDLLKRALESVWTQSFTDYEVIVVDDGSTDGTIEMLEARKSGLTALKVIRQANAGPGAARNRGAKEATGDYLAFLDSDDLWLSWTLETHARAIKKHNPTMSSGAFVSFTDEARVRNLTQEPFAMQHFGSFLEAFTDDVVPCNGTPSITVSRDAFQSVQGFMTANLNGEDTDLWLRLAAHPGYVRIGAPCVFAQRIHEQNTSLDNQKTVRGMNVIIRRERDGGYSGLAEFMWKRRRIIAATARSVSLTTLKAGDRRSAWQIYKETLAWQIHLGRWRYVVGFPLRACFSRTQTPLA
jgi:glycosyltransferase involved in cell wall biosynthesis